jgi:hypothetical protein
VSISRLLPNDGRITSRRNVVDDPRTTAPNSPRGVHRRDEADEGVTRDGGLGSSPRGASARAGGTDEGGKGAGEGDGATGAASASAIVRGGTDRTPRGVRVLGR